MTQQAKEFLNCFGSPEQRRRREAALGRFKKGLRRRPDVRDAAESIEGFRERQAR